MKHFLIDFENVHEDGLLKLAATEEDAIYLLYTQNAAKISLDALAKINSRIIVIKVAAGKQSLDMHLVSYLGYLISKYGKDDEYIIVSNDTDFDGVISHWSGEHGFSKICKLSPNKIQNNETKAVPAETDKYSAMLLAGGAEAAVAAYVSSLIEKSEDDKNRKQTIYRALIKKYGQKKGLKYYTLIKKDI